ncbi:MAG: nitroreductase family protein [Candidatus Delongbacteria bacterium]|nr:nitroreductase family protein [Candidatus Delongbacteria bacterium]
MNDVLRTIAARRSIRRYEPTQIQPQTLQAILEAGLQAPSGHNDQSWYLVAIQNPELIDQISLGCKQAMSQIPIDWIAELGRNEAFHVFYHAPTIILVAARKDAVSPLADACACIQNMMIAAESLNLGSCWIGFATFFFSDPAHNRIVDLPDGYEVQYGVALGYKPEGSKSNPPAAKYPKFYHIIP